MKKFIFMMSKKVHMAMKIMCAKENISMARYVSSLIEADLKKRGVL